MLENLEKITNNLNSVLSFFQLSKSNFKCKVTEQGSGKIQDCQFPFKIGGELRYNCTTYAVSTKYES